MDLRAEYSEEELLKEVDRLARIFARAPFAGEAEDIAQDVVLVFLKLLRSGEPMETSSLKDFVRAVVWRRMRDLWRREAHRKQNDGEWAMLQRDAAHAWMSPEADFQTRSLRESWERVLATMPEPVREAYLLVTEEGLSYREAAARLGVSHHAVHKRLVRANQRLRMLLREFEDGAAPVLHARRAA